MKHIVKCLDLPVIVVAGTALQREIPARVEPDKVAIKAVLATGAEVPGCRLTRSQRFEWGEPRTRGGVR